MKEVPSVSKKVANRGPAPAPPPVPPRIAVASERHRKSWISPPPVIQEEDAENSSNEEPSRRLSFVQNPKKAPTPGKLTRSPSTTTVKSSTSIGSFNRNGEEKKGNLKTEFSSKSLNASTRSSMHSINSLPVIREQYCCCKRWTKLEKILLGIVSVLAILIVGLVITVGILSKDDNEEPFARIPLFTNLKR